MSLEEDLKKEDFHHRKKGCYVTVKIETWHSDIWDKDCEREYKWCGVHQKELCMCGFENGEH